MKKFIALISCFCLLMIFSISLASASIYTCDSAGNEKTSFYTNDTVHVTSDVNITNETKTIKFYVASHRSWSIGTNLSSVATTSKNITTNSSGYVPVSVLWSPRLTIGNYDVVADVNENETYDSQDFLYNATGNGFSVLEQPVPKLKVTKGENSPGDHNWYATDESENEMLQAVLEAGSYEGIDVNAIYLSAFGTGDDKANVRYVAACIDNDKNGSCEWGESIIGFGQYQRDDGIVSINTAGKLSLSPNSSVYLTFYYMMKNFSGIVGGETYGFQVVMMDALGSSTGNRAIVEGLPIKSAVKTVYSQVTTTTTLPTTTTIPTTTIPETTTTTIPEKEEEKVNLFVGLAVAVFVAIAIITIFYFFFLRPPPQVYHYKP